MKIISGSPLFRRLLIFIFALSALDFAAPAAFAGGRTADVSGLANRAALFVAGLFIELLNDRARLVQVSVLIVALGIGLLCWRK